MTENIDINAEYERVFGVESRPTLYDGNMEYLLFRQQIIETPTPSVDRSNLPFIGIKLLPYEEYFMDEKIKEFEGLDIRPFLIKKYDNNELICYGAGYFNVETSEFIVFGVSFSLYNDYHKLLLERFSYIRAAYHDGNIIREDNKIKIVNSISFETASLAASFILGQSSNFKEWKDYENKSLDFYYSRFKNLKQNSPEFLNVSKLVEEELDIKTIKQSENTIKNKSYGIINIIMSLLRHKNSKIQQLDTFSNLCAPTDFNIPSEKHIFMIKKTECCYAYGYFEDKSESFYLCRGSRIALIENISYAVTSSSKARKRFLDKFCLRYSDFYLVNKDVKCKSASAAASFALGEESDYTIWKDVHGKYLKEIYPWYFFSLMEIKEYPTSEIISMKNLVFHLISSISNERMCNAQATYDESTGKMTLKKGSLISHDVTSKFRYSSSGVKRLNIIFKSCKKQSNGYMLIMDLILNSPDEAASIAIGDFTNGWETWITSEGKSLKSYIY